MNLKQILFTALFWHSFFNLNSQNHTLYPNVNPIIELEQQIENDQLVLSDESKIYKVNLYNRSTEELTTYQNTTKTIAINLNNLNTSYYSVMVYNGNNRIIILGVDVFNNNPIKIASVTNVTNTTTDLKSEIKHSAEINRKAKAYWVIKEIQKHSGSTISTYYYHNKKYMENAVRKNKSDVKSFSGKNNRLTIYEVYDLEGFSSIKPKLVSNYYYSKDLTLDENERKTFNIIPLYKSNSRTGLVSKLNE